MRNVSFLEESMWNFGIIESSGSSECHHHGDGEPWLKTVLHSFHCPLYPAVVWGKLTVKVPQRQFPHNGKSKNVVIVVLEPLEAD